VNHRPYTTPPGTLKITVLDRFGDPVDGATILVDSHSYATKLNPAHTPFSLPPVPCFWNYTDTKGECLLKLGENDYTIHIWSRLGSVPNHQISIEEGQEYSRTFHVDGKMPTHDIRPNNLGTISGNSDTIRFGFNVLEGTQEQVNLFEATLHPQPIYMSRDIDFFICDRENYIAYLKGYEFDCYNLEENVVDGWVEVTVPKDSDWYFVFSNTEPLQTGKKIGITGDLGKGNDDEDNLLDTLVDNLFFAMGGCAALAAAAVAMVVTGKKRRRAEGTGLIDDGEEERGGHEGHGSDEHEAHGSGNHENHKGGEAPGSGGVAEAEVVEDG